MSGEVAARILLVEDEPSNVKLITRVLERRGGFTVHHTEDPAEALRLVTAREVALVIMDVSLSGSIYKGQPVDGLEITRLIKADPRSADVPVVLATAHTMKGDREALLAASGADEYVGKPIVDFDAFIGLVTRLLASR
ncbi:MAG: response regulator [bacterium]